jgi:hypothetical protein
MNQLIFIGILFCIGWLLQRNKNFPDSSVKVLNQFVIHVSLPALILAKIPFLQLDSTIWQPVALAWLSILCGVLLVYFAAKLYSWSREITAAMLVVVPLGNTSFVGVPMIQALVGEEGVPIAILFDQLGSFLALIFYGSWVIAWYKKDPNSNGIGMDVFKKIALFPPFWSMLLAFSFTSVLQQSYLNEPLTLVGNTLVPVVVVALGMQFKIKLPSGNLQPLLSGLMIKLAIMPALVFIAVKVLGWGGMPVHVSILESAMASMISAGAIVLAAGIAKDLVAALVSWGLLISFITVPVLNWLL